MDVKGTTPRDRLVGELADRQHGVVRRDQLLEAGLSRQSILNSLRAGRLRRMFRGVYAVGHVAVSREGWWQAALLACGEGAVLGHRSATQLWHLRRGEIFPISVIVPRNAGRKHDRVRPYRTALDRSEWMRLDGLRVTTPARTIVDVAGELDPHQLRQLVEQAQDLRRFDAAEIRAVLARHPRQAGKRVLLDFIRLLEPDADGARSHLERLFLPLARRAGAPRPEVNVEIAGRRRDFVWREARLVVEVDGYAYHSSRRAMRRDRERDRRLTAAGWRPTRFTFEEIAFEPHVIVRDLTSLLGLSAHTSD